MDKDKSQWMRAVMFVHKVNIDTKTSQPWWNQSELWIDSLYVYINIWNKNKIASDSKLKVTTHGSVFETQLGWLVLLTDQRRNIYISSKGSENALDDIKPHFLMKTFNVIGIIGSPLSKVEWFFCLLLVS